VAWWLSALGAILFVDVIVQVSCAFIAARHFARPRSLRAQLFNPVFDCESVVCEADDGLLLKGSLLRSDGSPRGVVLYCHEYAGDRWSIQNFCSEQVFANYDLVTFDFRNVGESGRQAGYEPLHWISDLDVADVRSMIRFVRSREEWATLPLVVMGVSRGANAAIAAATAEPVAGVVGVGAFSTHATALSYFLQEIRRRAPWVLRVPMWHIRSTLALAIRWAGWARGRRFVEIGRLIRRLDAPLLLIAGSADRYIPSSVTKGLRKMARWAELWTAQGGHHNGEREANPEQFDARLSAFLDAVCASRESVVPASPATKSETHPQLAV
jgi:pimeloyl-ACP methyl ester carboxylesterase